jgi:ferredoxin
MPDQPGAHRRPQRPAVDWTACRAHGACADLLPELIALDEWGYPIIADGPVPAALQREARRVVSLCPRLALLLEQRDAHRT